MGYILDNNQEDLIQLVRQFAERELQPFVEAYDEKGEFPYEISQRAMEMGLHAMSIPECYGGVGLDLKTSSLMLAELAKADLGFSGTFAVTNMAAKCVMALGQEEQKQRFAEIIVPGAHASFCLTEPQSGSDASNLNTTAVRDGNNYVLNGRKCFISSAPISKAYIVMAVTNKSRGAKGLSAFIVERDRPGLSLGKNEKKLGVRTSLTCDVVFDDCLVPAANRLGEEGQGFILAMKVLDASRITMAACANALAERALEESVKYAKARTAFGHPIAEMQAIKFMLADMAISVEAGIQLTEHAFYAESTQENFAKEAALAKCFSTDSAMKVAMDAVQIFGGYGLMKDYPVEKLMREAKVLQIVEGTNQIQRNIIAANILK